MPQVIDYANLQFPMSITAEAGTVLQDIYGRVYEAGITEAAGASSQIIAQLGYGPIGTNPSTDAGWVWIDASYNFQAGNEDEYRASFTAPLAAGQYAYTYRFALVQNGVTSDFTYGDLDGAGTGAGLSFDASKLGTLTVTSSVTPNHPVVASAPATATVAEDTQTAISGLSISDEDAAQAPAGVYEVTLTATQGSLTLTTITGLTFTAGDGTSDGSMTFHGVLSDINTALATAEFTAASNYSGSATITLSATDSYGGVVATGSGAGTSSSATTNVTVTGVDDSATGTLGVTGSAKEGATLTASLTGASDADGAITNTAYQWQQFVANPSGADTLNGVAGTWTNLDGATNAAFNIPIDPSYHDAYLRVLVATTDSLGGITSFQSSAQLVARAGIEGDNSPNTLTGTSGTDTIYGFGGNDTLSGGFGNDTLLGGLGVDTMYGGAGNDTYGVHESGDVASEESTPGVDDGGTDLVNSSVSFTLGNYIENLSLVAGAAIDGTGNALANRIIGNNAVNTIDGGDGNDTLNGNGGADFVYGDAGNDSVSGGAGADHLYGGSGNDTYGVDNVGDIASEETTPGVDDGGTDLVNASVSFTLGNFVENLTLTGSAAIDGTGNALANRIIGNGAANTLSGGDGNDTLSGGAGADVLHGDGGNDAISGGVGADTMYGGSGNDAYTVDNSGDLVSEESSLGVDDGGNDIVNSSVSFTLGNFIENLTLKGAGSINGTGNELANRITGNDAANTLSGGGGNDQLYGNGGADVLHGGAAGDTLSGGSGNDWLYGEGGTDTLIGGVDNDVFVFSAPEPGFKDKITDFTTGADKIGIHASDFGLSVGNGLTVSGELDPTWFVSGDHATATEAHGQFVFDTSSQTLMWDSDGTGAAAAQALVSLNVNLSSGDFLTF